MIDILALDLARVTGWACRNTNLEIFSGSIDLGFIPDETLGAKLLRFERWLASIAIMEPGGLVVCERAHHRGGAATRQALGMEACLEIFAYKNDCNLEYVHTGTLKKHATGSGCSKKPAIIAAAKERWPDIVIEDDNHADALWLLNWGEKHNR